MKKNLYILLIVFISCVPIKAEISQEESWGTWFKSFFTKQPMMEIKADNISVRINQMFNGTQSFIAQLNAFTWDSDVSGFCEKYKDWVRQYKDIINEESNGHTVLNLWLDAASGKISPTQMSLLRDVLQYLYSIGARLNKQEIKDRKEAGKNYELLGIPCVLECPVCK